MEGILPNAQACVNEILCVFRVGTYVMQMRRRMVGGEELGKWSSRDG